MTMQHIMVARIAFAASLLALTTMPGFAYDKVGPDLVQQAAPNVEASVISKFSCNGSNERNGTEVWMYRYTARPGFRVIVPPNWGAAVGGRDFASAQDAQKVLTQTCSSFCDAIYDEDAATASRAYQAAYAQFVQGGGRDQGLYRQAMCHKLVLEFLQRTSTPGGN